MAPIPRFIVPDSCTNLDHQVHIKAADHERKRGREIDLNEIPNPRIASALLRRLTETESSEGLRLAGPMLTNLAPQAANHPTTIIV